MAARESFRIFVSKDYLKFSAAHFMAYKGFREALHGHNYLVSVEVEGELGANGYVIDFGVVKRITRETCAELDERMIIPTKSDCLAVEEGAEQIVLISESGRFSFPRADCVLLPIVHSSVEELACYLAQQVWAKLRAQGPTKVMAIQVGVEETSGQVAYYRAEV